MSIQEINEKRLDLKKVPYHIAIVMDGNGRWAQRRGLSRIEGHQRGLEAAQTVVEACEALGVKILTLYAFSKENWRRPKREVNALIGLLQEYLKERQKELLERDICINIIGDLDDLPTSVRDTLVETVEKTGRKKGLIVNLALSYGGRSEIVAAVKKLIDEVEARRITKDEITPESFSRYLFTGNLPDPDLLIRTSGELRISNFLLWQIAYTELYFTTTLWPDFGKEELINACIEYQNRERRFGLTASQIRKGELSQ
ncbi:MAG: isoprenyl transferase [Deltaproteobacteria bacterium]|nr:isoprenyl transferase [Deltaproteobacteria bacterium]